jgi:hypothetical protein
MAKESDQPADIGSNFVRQLVTDPKSVPDVMRLYGYLGASSEEGHERLYLNPDLTNYVEVPVQAMLHRMPVPTDQDPYGAVVLWVKKDAALIHKMTPAAQAMAHYFRGAIEAGMVGMAAASAVGGVPQAAGVTPQAVVAAAAGMAPQVAAFWGPTRLECSQVGCDTQVCFTVGCHRSWYYCPQAAAGIAPQAAAWPSLPALWCRPNWPI